MLSRWPLLIEYPVTDADRDGDGCCRPESIDAWLTATRDAYLDTLTQLAGGLDIQHRPAGDLPRVLGVPPSVAVSAGVAEVHPETFTINTRIRALGGTDSAVTVRWVVRQVDAGGAAIPVSTALRDELIAAEHAASEFN